MTTAQDGSITQSNNVLASQFHPNLEFVIELDRFISVKRKVPRKVSRAELLNLLGNQQKPDKLGTETKPSIRETRRNENDEHSLSEVSTPANTDKVLLVKEVETSPKLKSCHQLKAHVGVAETNQHPFVRETTIEHLDKPTKCLRQAQWTDSIRLSRRFCMIPEEQLNLLNRGDSWLPPDLGQNFPAANVPISLLKLWNDVVEDVDRKEIPSPDHAPTQKRSSTSSKNSFHESEVEESGSTDSDGETVSELSWEQSDLENETCRVMGSNFPPDSSCASSPYIRNIDPLELTSNTTEAQPKHVKPTRYDLEPATTSPEIQMLNRLDSFQSSSEYRLPTEHVLQSTPICAAQHATGPQTPGTETSAIDIQVKETPSKITPRTKAGSSQRSISQLACVKSHATDSSVTAIPSTIEYQSCEAKKGQKLDLLCTEDTPMRRANNASLYWPANCSARSNDEGYKNISGKYCSSPPVKGIINERVLGSTNLPKKRKTGSDENQTDKNAIGKKVKRLSTNFGFSQDAPLSQDPRTTALKLREEIKARNRNYKCPSEVRYSKESKPSTPISEVSPSPVSLYEKYKQCYSRYTGSREIFRGSCLYLYKVLQTDSKFSEDSWDDFIFHYCESYQPYQSHCMKRGEDPVPYDHFFASTKKDPHCNGRTVTLKSIKDAMSMKRGDQYTPSKPKANSSKGGNASKSMYSTEAEDKQPFLMDCEHGWPHRSTEHEKENWKPDQSDARELTSKMTHPVEVKDFNKADTKQKNKVVKKRTEIVPKLNSVSYLEWYKEPNTPFKEFLRSYMRLKSVKGLLGLIDEKGRAVHLTESRSIFGWSI